MDIRRDLNEIEHIHITPFYETRFHPPGPAGWTGSPPAEPPAGPAPETACIPAAAHIGWRYTPRRCGNGSGPRRRQCRAFRR